MRKSLIICIVGESGSGKSLLASALEKYANIPMIRSYTDRPRRTPDEDSHTFLEVSDFDLLDKNDFIASTNWNGYRYCCLRSDVSDVCTYVIDCAGLEMLRKKFANEYHILAIRIYRSKEARIASVGEERVARDAGKFYLSDDAFDRTFYNSNGRKLDLLVDVWLYVRSILWQRDGLTGVEDAVVFGTGYAERD